MEKRLETLRVLNNKLKCLKEEKIFIRKQINLNYSFAKERNRLYKLEDKCNEQIKEVNKEIMKYENRNTITVSNQKKS